MKFQVLWSGLCCYAKGWGGKCSEILAKIKLRLSPRVNKVFTHSNTHTQTHTQVINRFLNFWSRSSYILSQTEEYLLMSLFNNREQGGSYKN